MSKNVVNFSVGFFASVCAVFVPRMMSMLSNSEQVRHFDNDYIVVGLVFALIIGVITVIFEQSKNNKTAAETFMTALGIPALLAGTLNTGMAGNELHKSATTTNKLIESMQQQSGIQEEAAEIIFLQADPANGSSHFDFQLIPSAHAEEETGPDSGDGLNLGIRVEQKPYVVVLETTGDRAEAFNKVAELRKVAPLATVVQSDKSYLVIDNPQKREKSDALLAAIQLRKSAHLNPRLLQVK